VPSGNNACLLEFGIIRGGDQAHCTGYSSDLRHDGCLCLWALFQSHGGTYSSKPFMVGNSKSGSSRSLEAATGEELTLIISVVGARPNFVKLAALHKPLAKVFEHIIVHTGQHYDYEMSRVFFEHLGLPMPDYNLGVGSGSQGYQLGEMIKRVEGVLLKERPSLVIVYGDTNSTLAGALAAVKLCVPTAHVEAGLRSFDLKMPEEVNRVLTDTVSQYLFAPTRIAVNNLRKEHVGGRIYLCGDVMVDILQNSTKIAMERSRILDELKLRTKGYILVTIHRAGNTDSRQRLGRIVQMLTKIDGVIVFPVHPRTKKALQDLKLLSKIQSSNIRLVKPLGYLDFLKLMVNAKKVVTDSGGVQKEAYLLGTPCITLRDSTEWIETVREGWNILLDVNEDAFLEAVKKFEPDKTRKQVFGDGKASERIMEILSKDILR
jgi:UDP-N-acetylglucosamine 2-epimerase